VLIVQSRATFVLRTKEFPTEVPRTKSTVASIPPNSIVGDELVHSGSDLIELLDRPTGVSALHSKLCELRNVKKLHSGEIQLGPLLSALRSPRSRIFIRSSIRLEYSIGRGTAAHKTCDGFTEEGKALCMGQEGA
jgi:hypothetical protein